MKKTFLFNHVSEETALVIENVDYKFKKTSARYWIEHVEGKGDRLNFQFLDPETKEWNKVNRGVYFLIGVLYTVSNMPKPSIEGITSFATKEQTLKFLSDIGGVSNLIPEQLSIIKPIFGDVVEEQQKIALQNKISIHFEKNTTTGNLVECIIQLSVDEITSVKGIVTAINTEYNLKEISKVIKNGGNIKIKGITPNNVIKSIYTQSGIDELFREAKITKKGTSTYVSKPKEVALSIAKGNNVVLKDITNTFFKITKYSFNSLIELTYIDGYEGDKLVLRKDNADLPNFGKLIVSKDQILDKISDESVISKIEAEVIKDEEDTNLLNPDYHLYVSVTDDAFKG